MSLTSPIRRLFLIILIAGPMVLGGCSYIPWIGDSEDDLAFEEDFPFDDIQDSKGKGGDTEEKPAAFFFSFHPLHFAFIRVNRL